MIGYGCVAVEYKSISFAVHYTVEKAPITWEQPAIIRVFNHSLQVFIELQLNESVEGLSNLTVETVLIASFSIINVSLTILLSNSYFLCLISWHLVHSSVTRA